MPDLGSLRAFLPNLGSLWAVIALHSKKGFCLSSILKQDSKEQLDSDFNSLGWVGCLFCLVGISLQNDSGRAFHFQTQNELATGRLALLCKS